MPTTPNRKFSIPTTGSEVGIWGSNDLNPNFSALDNILGGVSTINLAGSGTLTLTDTQQQNMVLRFTGAMTGNWTITLTEPAYWIIDNQTTGAFNFTLGGSSGNVIATPQGSRMHVFWDGANAFHANLGEPGQYKTFGTASALSWINACSIPPYLICRGGTALIATFPALFAQIGTNFGGNGITTFGIPDRQGRTAFDLDNGAGRISSATYSPNGNTLGATGGTETHALIAAENGTHSHGVSDPGHNHSGANSRNYVFLGNNGSNGDATGHNEGTIFTGTSATNISIQNSGSGQAHPTISPGIIAGITYIKT